MSSESDAPRPWFLVLPPIAALLLVVAACGGGGAPQVEGDAPFGLESRVPLPALGFVGGLRPPQPLDRVRAFPALRFTRPVLLTAAPDASPWLYVAEQAGRIHVFESRDDVTDTSVFLDLEALVLRQGNEEGLLGLAFDPDWDETGGTFYVYYSAASPRRTVIARYQATFLAGETPIANAGSAEIVLEIPQPNTNHNGGQLVFGSDGMLYVGVGDGGGGNDPDRNGQDLSTLLGSILRLDVRGRTTYAVPSDNPFVGRPGARGEIFAYGLRNPWRFGFDANGTDLWVGDVGQVAREEITRVRRGENHGWPVYEGTRSNVNPGGLPLAAFSGPVLEYPRSVGTCVIGGLVVRGSTLPSLRGAYVYGDYGSGRIWALVMDGDQVFANEEVQNVARVCSFGEDHLGALYAVSLDGTLWRFRERAPQPEPGIPERLSETGLFTSTPALTPVDGLIPYRPNAEVWHDGAAMRRWIGIPGDGRIGFAAEAPWTFPEGTVLVQHLELSRRVETRILLKQRGEWGVFSYRWDEDQQDARLVEVQESATFEIEDGGGRREIGWTFLSRDACLRCHTPAAGTVLGVHTRQLNRPFAYEAVVDNQLRAWDHVRLFDARLGAPETYDAFVDPRDETAPGEARARAWMDVHCASCHRPLGPSPGDVDFREEIPEAAMRLVGVPPVNGNLGILDALRVAAGEPARSVTYERVVRTDATRMPPLGSEGPDPTGKALLEAWIIGR